MVTTAGQDSNKILPGRDASVSSKRSCFLYYQDTGETPQEVGSGARFPFHFRREFHFLLL